MADVTYLAEPKILDAYGREIPVDNTVRLNLDGSPIFTAPGRVPYKPQHFPLGNWWITAVALETGHLAPMAILTDAWQMVEAWALTADGKAYDHATGQMVRDEHYWIHFTDLFFTWGCIRVIQESDLRWFAAQVLDELAELRKLDPKQARISFEAKAA